MIAKTTSKWVQINRNPVSPPQSGEDRDVTLDLPGCQVEAKSISLVNRSRHKGHTKKCANQFLYVESVLCYGTTITGLRCKHSFIYRLGERARNEKNNIDLMEIQCISSNETKEEKVEFIFDVAHP